MFEDLIKRGVDEGIYPGAVLVVASRGDVKFHGAVGFSAILPDQQAITKDIIFDLASLTKPLGTTLAIMKLVDDRNLELDHNLTNILPVELPEDKRTINIRYLLAHTAGLVEWKPFFQEIIRINSKEPKAALREMLVNEPLLYIPGEKALYSDLGFMILEWIIEEVSGLPMPEYLDQKIYLPLALERTFFIEGNKTDRFNISDFAATEDCPWRKQIIRGAVHDDNAYAAGGYSGHAGLFSTAEEVYTIANMVREHYLGMRDDFFCPETVREFLTRQRIPEDSAWALGWDTPDPESSSTGSLFSANSVGHWGFTGTSVWMDLDKDVIVIFLTNRVHPSRDNDKIRAFRPILHDEIMKSL